jgi:hypothetical protein
MRRSYRHRNAGFIRQHLHQTKAMPSPTPNEPATNGPPYNPGLKKLIEAKREWHYRPDAEAGEQGFLGWHERGYLPHFDAPNVTQFVTFLLRDALPVVRRREWEPLLRERDESLRKANWKPGSTVATASAGCDARMSPGRSNKCCMPKTVKPIACARGH